MKKIYNFLTNLVPLMVLVLSVQVSYAQCPVGQTEVSITMSGETFTGENAWLLYDATAGSAVACVNSNPNEWVNNQTVTACVNDGNTIELYGYESFGDGWNGGQLDVWTTESGAANGCMNQNIFLFSGASSAFDNDRAAGTADSGINCVTPNDASFPNQVGDLMTTFSTMCVPPVVTCPPSPITVDTDPGVCDATFMVPDPVLAPGFVTLGVPGGIMNAQGMDFPLIFVNNGLVTTPFTIPGVSPVPPAATCVTEVCIDVTVTGDFGATVENPEVIAEGFSLGFIQGGLVGDCGTPGSTQSFCISVGLYNTLAADGVINMELGPDTAVNSFCAQETVSGAVNYATACVDFLNSFTGAANGPATYPKGETCFELTGTGSGNGMSFPIICEVCVIVEDNEAPTLNCPGDFTFNLQGGECEQIYDFEVTLSDNCPLEGEELPGSVFGSLGNCGGSGSSLACGLGTQGIVQEIDISALPMTEVTITDGCFVFDNAAWGNTMGTVNFYMEPAGATAAHAPMPCFSNNTPVATSGLQDFIALGATTGNEICVPVFVPGTMDPFVLPVGAPGLYMEVVNTGTGGNCVYMNTTCNGLSFGGAATFLWTTNCAPMSLYPNDIGFNIDAFYSFQGFSAGVEAPTIPGFNEYESGDALPIGEHCFRFEASDSAGNMAECEWCVTVNEIPEDLIVTSLACNDLVNVSLNADCQAFISADMFLEGGPYGCYFNCYEVFISGIAGDVNGQTIDLAPGTYTVTVNDACRDNSCWGEMIVEDKLPPMMPPIEDLYITCTEEVPDLLSAERPYPAVYPVEDIVGREITVGNGLESVEFEIESDCEITDLDVVVDLEHTWIGDISLSLISPNGTSISLWQAQCTTLDDINVVFDDEGVAANCNVASPGTGQHMQLWSGSLSALDGETMNGTWTVEWQDLVGGDDGEFNEVTLIFNDGEVICGATVTPDDYLTATANSCEIVDLVVAQEEVVGNSCDGTTLLRTWVATDASGNTSSKVQQIIQERIGVQDVNDEWFWPAGIVELTCGADASPEGIYNYYRDNWIANNPCPLPTCDETDGHNYDPAFVAYWECNANAAGVRMAYPFVFGGVCELQTSFLNNSCNIFFTYSDQVLPACGADCDGNNKVIRTWTALDWCTGETANAVQVIHAKDNEGPTASPLAPMTVSANPWGCAASFTLPVPDHLDDNCSNVVTYRVYGQPGTIAEVVAGPRVLLDEDDNVVYDENGYPVWVVDGLPKAMEPYLYTYELSDCCGNVSYITLQVTVVDGAAPIAVAKQNIVISLTSSPNDPQGGSAKLYVHSVDNGSHDGDCGPVRVAIRRLDDGVCGSYGAGDHENNTTFFNFNDLPNSQQPANHDRDDTDEGQYVKFCCQDLVDGEGEDLDGDGINDYVLIDVELGVWDDANMDGVPGTPGDLFGVTWATVRVEAKLQPTLVCPPLAKITCEMDEKDLSVTGGAAHASSTCGNLDVEYFDLCGLDINQDGEITEFTVTDQNGMFINEVGMCTDVNRDGRIANYTAPWWSTVDEDLFNKACHYGPITRWWSIAGTNVQCRQLIIVEEPTATFNGDTSIDWPYSEDEFIRLADNDGDDCGLMEVRSGDIEQIDTNDDDIPDYAEVRLSCIDGLCDQPYWVDANCSLIGWSLDSDTFYFEGDACRKIINTYTVIDWCQYNPNNPSNGGIWTWTVIGKLIDTYAPVVEAEDDMFDAVPGSGGSGTSIDERACVGVGIQMSATAYDTNVDENGEVIENACPSEWLKWNVYVDIYNDWVFDREWSSFVAEDRNTSTDPLWSEDNAADNMAVYGYLIPDVRVGNRGGVDNNEGDFATPPGFEYTINIPDQIPADCGETVHRVEWKVYDGCGNVSSTTSYFTVQDKKAPTPYCVNLSTALMADPDGAGPLESMVELWAIDFDYGSFDNCVAYEDLRFTFTDVQPELDPDYNHDLRSSARVFTCDDLVGTNDATLTIPIYVWDLCGNYDFCQVNLRLVDNNPDGCGDTTGTGSIAGLVETEFGQSIENVEVNNENMFYEFDTDDMTGNDGRYAFESNLLAMDYQVTADKNDDFLNGVSTLDLVLIQRHILGLESLDSAYKLIAADVNNDGAVTAIDLIELRKLILGIYNELPNNSSWRFVDAAQTLDINNPWNFDETIDIYNLSTDMLNENFVGIKVGDVNQSVVANSATGSTEDRSSAVVNIDFEDIQVEVGQTFDLTVNGDAFNNIYGYQFTLASEGLELVSVQSGAVNVTEENFGVHGGAITTSWNSQTPVSADGALFTMTFKATAAGLVSDLIDVNSDITRAEAYVGSDLDIVNIDLASGAEADVEFALYQNEPNPFTANTVIGFEMPQNADATFTILDVTGKVVKTVQGNFAKGYNEIELSKSDLGAAGVYYYQLDSGEFTATKKMIIIE